jgi:MFS transporter, OFA family, oxalate/formate antiporter
MLVMPFGGFLAQRDWNPKLLILIGSAFAYPCLFLSYAMNKFTGFAILYILAFGLNHGICYMVPIHHGWLWFPERPGLVSGIVIGGFGVSGIIFDNMFTRMINPDNEPI